MESLKSVRLEVDGHEYRTGFDSGVSCMHRSDVLCEHHVQDGDL